MAYAAGLSKTQLLAFKQCARKLWLAQYHPELEEPAPHLDAALETGRVVGELARQVYGPGEHITFEAGQRGAVNATRALLEAGGSTPIFEATFDHEGLVVQVDILARGSEQPRLIEVKASASVKEHHLIDCAIQAWTVEQLGQPLGQIILAHVDAEFVYTGDGNYQGVFVEQDLTEPVRKLMPTVPELVGQARATLSSGDEPDIAVGPHCFSPHDCPFYPHCAPAQGRYPIMSLGGNKQRLFDLIREGYQDLREVPEDDLGNETQQRIWRQSRAEQPYVGKGIATFLAALERPRYYLDFETIAVPRPIWAGTRPYEVLPFQWSCHIDDGEHELMHRAFLDLSGESPMRHCAEQLIATLGDAGPVIVYTSYEKRVIHELKALFPDLETELSAIHKRLVDLHPLIREDYYHPDMQGSWSLKALLPTIAPELDYGHLGEVQDGFAAQRAYLEASNPETSPERREKIRQHLLDYCGYDTLALVKIVAHFSAA